MQCRTCGAEIPEGGVAEFCPKCSFSSALGMGTAGTGPIGTIEGYELINELGRGGMGVVWLARERSLDRLVALKVIAVADPRLQQRLLREGQAAARLRHPHIVAVHAMGGSGTSTFLAMEFIEGGNLDAHLSGRPLPPRAAAEIAAKLAGALAHAHEAGLLHRDVKPSNILLDLDGKPMLADFGLAAPTQGAGDLTSPGSVAGTPAFLAPELLGGSENARPESDVYGLGAVLYNCLTGRPPFVGASAAAVLAQLHDNDPIAPHLLQAGLPRDLETICMKCLDRLPERRYASAELLQADLNAFLRGEPISARPAGRIERAVRYCRRRPALALSTGLAAALLLTLAIGGPLMALRLARSQRGEVAARQRAEKAEAATMERLRESLLARSRATRLSAGKGQRDEALAAASEAAQIRTGLDARDEVIAALARPEVVQLHETPVANFGGTNFSLDPDHDRYAVETSKGQIEMRRLSDNSLIQAFSGPASFIWSRPSFSADGRYLAARNGDAQMLVWAVGKPDPLLVVADRPYLLAGRFKGYGGPDAFSPDGAVLASALPTSGVSLQSTVDGRELRRITTESAVTHLAYSPDGRWLAAGRGLRGSHGENIASLRVFDASSGEEACRLPIDASYQTIAWSPAGDRLMTGGEEIRMFHIPSAKQACRLSDPLAVKAFFGPGGTTVFSAASSGIATLWDLGSARPLLVASLGSNPDVALSRDGTLIAKSVGSSSIRLYRLEMSRVVRALPVASSLERDNVLSAALPVIDYSPDGRWLATAVWGAIQLRDAAGNAVSVVALGSISNYCSVRFSRDSQSVLAASSELGLVRLPIQNAKDGTPELGPASPIDPEKGFYIADVSRDGARAVLTSFMGGKCKIEALDGTAPVLRWDLPGAAGAAFVADDREVLVNSLEDSHGALLELRDAQTGALRRTLNYRHGAHVHVTADGAWALVGAGPDVSLLLRTSDWTPGPSLPTEVQGRGTQMAFSPDGAFMAFGDGDKVVLVRSSDGAVLADLQAPQSGTYLPGLAFSPDGARLALWWENGQLALWDLRTLRRELGARGLDW